MNDLLDRKSREDAVKALRHCMDDGFVQFLPHFKLRCRERGIDLPDVMNVLKRGNIYAEPELDLRRNQWRYKVEGHTSERDELAVIVTFADEDTTIVITAICP